MSERVRPGATQELGREWKPVSEGGWELKATVFGRHEDASIFERCDWE